MKGKKYIRSFMKSFTVAIMTAMVVMSSMCVCYAAPNGELEETAWVEVKCTVAEEYKEDAGLIVSNSETGETYTLKILAVNDYVCRQKLPLGNYIIDHAYTSDSFIYEALPNVNSFSLTKDMNAAAAIKVDIHKSDLTMIETTPESSEEPAVSEPEQPAAEDQPIAPEDIIVEEEKIPFKDTLWGKLLIRVGIPVLGALIFTGLIFGFVYYVRKNSDD